MKLPTVDKSDFVGLEFDPGATCFCLYINGRAPKLTNELKREFDIESAVVYQSGEGPVQTSKENNPNQCFAWTPPMVRGVPHICCEININIKKN